MGGAVGIRKIAATTSMTTLDIFCALCIKSLMYAPYLWKLCNSPTGSKLWFSCSSRRECRLIEVDFSEWKVPSRVASTICGMCSHQATDLQFWDDGNRQRSTKNKKVGTIKQSVWFYFCIESESAKLRQIDEFEPSRVIAPRNICTLVHEYSFSPYFLWFSLFLQIIE